MAFEERVNLLRKGDPFRDWLVKILGERIRDDRCNVAVFKLSPASHTVCRYEFRGEDYSVVSKFYAEPTGWKRKYDHACAMDEEYKVLKRLSSIIDVPKPIAARKKYSCALVTEYVKGRTLYSYVKAEDGLYDRLAEVAGLLRRLHDGTPSEYRKDREFARFHKVLDELRLDRSSREAYNRILGKWWYSSLLDLPHGCTIHSDAHLGNYIFNHEKVYALDFESSWEGASPVHDLGIAAAELKHYFARKKKDSPRAEPYIGHFLWHYSKGDENYFHGVTRALPFFMSLGLLRMARLNLGKEHRDYVLREAMACLKTKELDGSG